MDRIIEIALGIIRTIEMIKAQEILEGIWEQIKIIQDRITEEDMEEITEIIIMKKVEVGLEKQFSDNARRNDRSSSSRSRSGIRTSTKRDRIRCY